MPHTSHPRNRNIANVFYKAGFIESWGRGIGKVTEGFKDAGLPIPKFKSAFGGVLVTIPRPSMVSDTLNNGDDAANFVNEGVNATNVGGHVGGHVGGQSDIKMQVLEIIRSNEGVNTSGISERLPNIVKRTIERYIKELKNEDLIEFIGTNRSGGYYIK